MTAPGFGARWTARWQRAGQDHRAIFSGMFVVAAFSLFAKLVAAGKEMALAWRFGVGSDVDAYLFLFNLLNWPVSVWFSVLTVIVIPLEAEYRRTAPERLASFRAELLGFTAVIGTALVVAAAIGLPSLLASAWLGLPPATARAAQRMLPALAVMTLPGLLVGVFSTWMMSSGRYANTLYEGVPALGLLVALLISGRPGALVWGTLAGFTVHLLLVARDPSRVSPSLRLGFTSPAWAVFWQGFGIVVLGQAIMSLTAVIDQFFAAHLPAGAISSIGYASRLLALANGLVATAVTRATLPVFARTSEGSGDAVLGTARRWAAILFGVGLLTVAAGWLLAPIGARLLFERGTFTTGDTASVAHLVRLGLLQLPFYFSSLVFVSLHSSRRRYSIIFASSVLGLCVKALTVAVLLPRLGIDSLMLSGAVMYGANAILLAALARR